MNAEPLTATAGLQRNQNQTLLENEAKSKLFLKNYITAVSNMALANSLMQK